MIFHPAKYFTPALSYDERVAFYQALGLSQVQFLYEEKFAASASRFLKNSPAGFEPLLSSPPPHLPKIQGTLSPEIFSVESERSLWSDIFPYPFSCLDRAKSIHFSCPGLEKSVAELIAAFKRLEVESTRREVTLLNVMSDWGSFPILIQTVRKRRVRIGSSSALKRLLAPSQHDNTRGERLRSFFSTTTALYSCDLHGASEVEWISFLASRLGEALEKPLEQIETFAVAGHLKPDEFRL